MIVGTAGHIDHGKTTLVQALTGVDTDRLPEEKRRGISIELGYAFLDDGQGLRVGFVDVPGHERLVHTMLAGATGLDRVLLLVAADDGPMPQTREHLAIVSLLGIERGAVVITKCDRVDAARLDAVEAEIDALLAATPLAQAPRFRTAATTGEGIAPLRDWLLAEAAADAGQTSEAVGPAAPGFRLAIDRVFTLAGIGTVATGTVFAGTVQVGDEVALAPGGPRMRVRSLHAQNRVTERAQRGERCALNLAGVERDALARGQWLCAPALALATDRIDTMLTVWPDEPESLRGGTTVHLHLGATDVLARVAPLDGEAIAPGATARAQLILREPVAAWQADRVVLRDASARRTVAGGRVLDPEAPARYRRTPQRLAELDALTRPVPADRLHALRDHAPLGVAARRFARAAGLLEIPAPAADTVVIDTPEETWHFAPGHWAALRRTLLDGLSAFHQKEPDVLGLDAGRLRRLCLPRVPTACVTRAVEEWLAEGQIQRHGALLHRPEHGARLGEAERRVAERLLPRIAEGRCDPPWVRDLARDTGLSEPTVRTTLQSLARRGEVFAVVRDLYYGAPAMTELSTIARSLAAEHGLVRAADFRDRTGLGRKRAIQVLEFFDRVGVLRRSGDVHHLRTDSTMFLH